VRGLIAKAPISASASATRSSAWPSGTTFKLKFGHHGANHPVKDLLTGRVEITAQNHGFAVDRSRGEGRARRTHLNLNDGTSEGMPHR